MRINEAAQATGLSKKAIRHYEEKELIKVEKYDASGYKDYDEKTLETLYQIAFLRSIDMSIMDIKLFLKSDDKKALLQDHMKKIESKINELKNIKRAINTAMESEPDYLDLYTSVDSARKNQSDYILNKIKTLFPTAFGDYIVMHFGEYLNEAIDTKQKESALESIIDFIDNLDESPIEDSLSNHFSNVNATDMNQMQKSIDTKLKEMRMDFNNKEQIDALKVEIDRNKILMQEIMESYPQMKDEKEILANFLRDCGYYEKFVDNLRILSKKYDDYLTYYEKLDKIIADV